MFEHMQVLTIKAFFRAEADGTLPPYLGSTLRGILGHCMREFVCSETTVRCFRCGGRKKCTYARYFCSTGGEAGAVNPFVIHPLTRDKTEWRKGDRCAFELTLIGDGARQADLFLRAVKAMESKGWGAMRIPFRLLQILEPASKTLIAGAGKFWTDNLRPEPLSCRGRTASSVLLSFDTPLRVISGGELCRTLPFPVLIRFLSRRISLLSQAYTQHLVEWEEEEIEKAAERVEIRQEEWRIHEFERYSMNQPGNRLALTAVEGWVIYEGELTPFTPLLEAGELLHVGKNSTIGFGHYTAAYGGSKP